MNEYINKIKCEHIKNGLILPENNYFSNRCLGGVLDENDNYVKLSGYYPLTIDEVVSPIGGKYPYNHYRYVDENIVFGGIVNFNEWGHFLLDWSNRLWYCVENDNWTKVCFVVNGIIDTFLPTIMELLEIIGIKRNDIIILCDDEIPIKAKEVIVPQQSMDGGGIFREEIDFISYVKNEVRKRAKDKSLLRFDKIYFTRTQLTPQKEIGEKYIEEVFKKLDYSIISPEKYSAIEQIWMVMNAETVVSIEGSVAHNIIFADKRTRQH